MAVTTLIPHLKNSIVATRNFVQNYNKSKEDIDPALAKKHKIKATHLRTAEQIIRLFYGHQCNVDNTVIARNGAMPDVGQTIFRTNNVALANALCLNKSTTYRHIKKLELCKFITFKEWHGTKTSYAIQINPECLVADFNPRVEETIINNYMVEMSKTSLTDEDYLKIREISRPSFSTNYNGLIAVCNPKENGSLMEHNINMNKEFSLKTTSTENLAINVCFNENKNIKQSSQAQIDLKMEHQEKKPILNQFSLTVIAAWNISKQLLWREREFCAAEIFSAKQLIQRILDSEKEVASDIKFTIFCEKIMLAHKFLLKSPERFIPNPVTWFDPVFSEGYSGTAKWFAKVVEQRKSNKEYYSNLKLIAQCYREFIKNPTSIERYNKISAFLAKKRDKRLVDVFNTLVSGNKTEILDAYNQFYSNNSLQN